MNRTMSVSIEVSVDQIADLLARGLEAASGAWLQEFDLAPVREHFGTGSEQDEEALFTAWLEAGESVDFIRLQVSQTGEWCSINREEIEAGLQRFADLQPDHLVDVLGGVIDADLADRFLQCLAIGFVRY